MTRLAVALAAVASLAGACSDGGPPTLELGAGVHPGPLVLDRATRVAGEPGAVVRGGIRIAADGVSVREVKVVGGEYGVEVEGAEDVVLERVAVEGAELDGINVRRGSVTIRDCRVGGLRHPRAQGIDISFSFDMEPSVVEGCRIAGGYEGIVTHSARVELRGNAVRRTTLRAISVTEMSSGAVRGNEVTDALGVGIFCGDFSHCLIERNRVTGTRPDPESGDLTRAGHPIQARFGAEATLAGNELERNGGAVSAVGDAQVHRG